MSDEEFYDKEIAPLLLRAAELCVQRSLPMFASVEYRPDSWGDTQVRLHQSDTMALTALARKSVGNIDRLAISWKRFAEEQGRTHNSIVLHMMEPRPHD
jgi:hypothetical protein